MNVYVENSMLRLEFRFDKRINKRIKQIAGYQFDRQRKTWYVPTAQIRRVFELFPKASYAPECFALEDQAARNFVRNMTNLGVRLAIDAAGDVVATNLDERHVLHEALRERSDWLRAYVAENCEKRAESDVLMHEGQMMPESRRNGDRGKGTQDQGNFDSERERRIAEATIAGMKNAAKNAERKERYVEAARQRKRDSMVQGSLL